MLRCKVYQWHEKGEKETDVQNQNDRLEVGQEFDEVHVDEDCQQNYCEVE
jgi:hypothetical protein